MWKQFLAALNYLRMDAKQTKFCTTWKYTQWWTAGREQCSSLRFDVYLVHTKKGFLGGLWEYEDYCRVLLNRPVQLFGTFAWKGSIWYVRSKFGPSSLVQIMTSLLQHNLIYWVLFRLWLKHVCGFESWLGSHCGTMSSTHHYVLLY